MTEIVTAVPLRDQITNIVRDMIISGKFANEQKISERQISAMLNVSTTPVKEAFRVLQAEGLIYSVPRKGSFVSSYSKENIRQIIYLRSSVDAVAAYFAAVYATKEEIGLMEKALEKSRTLIEVCEGQEKISENNSFFHEQVRIAARNNYIVNIGTTVRNIDDSVRRVVNADDFELMMRRQEEHEQILQAIKDGKSERAEQIMRRHIRQSVDSIV